MTTYKINLQSYIKLLMHSLKYPYAKVNGLLLAAKSNGQTAGDSKAIEFVDYIPLFHFNQGLTAMLEIALIQAQAYCAKHDLQIAGYFQANKSFHDTSIDVFAQRIGDKLAELNPSTAILVLNSRNLADALSKSELDLDKSLNLYENQDGKWRTGSVTIESNNLLEAIRYFIFQQADHLSLADFDCHLHDIKCDWLNKGINRLIEDWQAGDPE